MMVMVGLASLASRRQLCRAHQRLGSLYRTPAAFFFSASVLLLRQAQQAAKIATQDSRLIHFVKILKQCLVFRQFNVHQTEGCITPKAKAVDFQGVNGSQNGPCRNGTTNNSNIGMPSCNLNSRSV
jgi:hypothetical protein